ncbi:hypothetical protein [Baaleninema sp.]|uniref:hypothetical protein n=1 Tax=Baaleninema sp. TaxID=3101197 RepID=UPI003CFF86B3
MNPNSDATAMHRKGFVFYRWENGVWLVDTVPVECLNRLDRPSVFDSFVTIPTDRTGYCQLAFLEDCTLWKLANSEPRTFASPRF